MPQQISMPITDPIKRAEYNREYQKKNREKIYAKHRAWLEANKTAQSEYHREYHKEWYAKNGEKRKVQLSEYQKNHKGDHVKRVQKYTKKNKEKVYTYGKQYNQTNEGKYRSYLSSAQKRTYNFELTIDEFSEIILRSCVYCGDVDKIGIDRIDNSIGYTKENSASCCKTCNYMKKTFSVHDFLSHIKKIYIQNEKRSS